MPYSGMQTREQSLADLKAILNHLGPGAWLHIDDRWMEHAFGLDKKAAAQAAKNFAQSNQCVFRYEPDAGGSGEGVGIFGREYFKEDGDA